MTRSELVEKLALYFPQLSQRDTDLAVRIVLDTMAETLNSGHRIEIRGFGSFVLNYRSARIGRNPKSGQSVDIPSKSVPHFKVGKQLRERVNYQK